MQELQEFLDKQKDLNLQMLEDMLNSQSLQLHNLQVGLNCLRDTVKQYQSFRNSKLNNKYLHKLYHNIDANAFIHLERDISILYCNQEFKIPVSIRDFRGLLMKKEEYMIQIKLFTSEKFPKEVVINSKGKPLFTGKTKLAIKGQGEFSKLNITEPTINFPSNKFNMVIFSISPEVQSLIVEGVTVQRKKY